MAQVLNGKSRLIIQAFNICISRQIIQPSRNGLGILNPNHNSLSMFKVHKLSRFQKRLTWMRKRNFYRNGSVTMRTPATNYDQNETITYSHTQNCSSKLSNFSVLHENVSRFSSNAPSLASSPHSQNPSLNPPGIIVPPQLLKGAYLWNRCENVNWISPFHVSQKILRSAHISGTFHSHHKHPTHHRAFASPLDQMVTHFSTLQSKHVCHHVPRPNGISQRSHQQFIKNYSTASRIVESSPNFIQPYLRLIRMDKPIGKCLFFYS